MKRFATKLSLLWSEARNFRQFFNPNICAENFVFKVFLPMHDIVSDFLVAEKMSRSEEAGVRTGIRR